MAVAIFCALINMKSGYSRFSLTLLLRYSGIGNIAEIRKPKNLNFSIKLKRYRIISTAMTASRQINSEGGDRAAADKDPSWKKKMSEILRGVFICIY